MMTTRDLRLGLLALLWAACAALLFTTDSAWAHGMSAEQRAALLEGGFFGFVQVGAEHMLTGYDHILFLSAVLFLVYTPRDVVRLVTAFTLGHSLTLLGGALFDFSLPYLAVEAVIALSIVYKAIENLDGYRNWFLFTPPPTLLMVFGFGLVHGLGLAARLEDVGLPDEGALAIILGFNVGVELGQILALVIVLPLLALVRQFGNFEALKRVANAGLIVAGLGLFAIHAHAFAHLSNWEIFGVAHDHAEEHSH